MITARSLCRTGGLAAAMRCSQTVQQITVYGIPDLCISRRGRMQRIALPLTQFGTARIDRFRHGRKSVFSVNRSINRNQPDFQFVDNPEQFAVIAIQIQAPAPA